MKKSLLEQMIAHLEQISDEDFAREWAACADEKIVGPTLAEFFSQQVPYCITDGFGETETYTVRPPKEATHWMSDFSDLNTTPATAGVFFSLISHYGYPCKTRGLQAVWL